MNGKRAILLRKLAALAGLALLAACQAAPPPPPRIIATAPPPLRPQVIPYRPLPPGGASPEMPIPAIGPDGVRETVISHMNPLEAVWNFRAAWNVAALNCMDAGYEPILEGYKALLVNHEKRLGAVNRELDRQYRSEYGRDATREREAYLTQVYNYFALPPARTYFCDATLQIAREALQSPPEDIDAFALENIQRLASAFEQFYRDFEKYQVDVALWDAQYGPLFAPSGGQRSGVVYTNAAATDAAAEGAARVQLNAPAGEPPRAVSEPVVQPLPPQGPGR